MSVSVVTGGSSGIGAAAVATLKESGHEVINVDLKNGDICANLATPEGRQTAMTDSLSDAAKFAVSALPIPVRYGSTALMNPEEIAESMKFLLSNAARGVNGIILFTDGGTDALLNSEKVY